MLASLHVEFVDDLHSNVCHRHFGGERLHERFAKQSIDKTPGGSGWGRILRCSLIVVGIWCLGVQRRELVESSPASFLAELAVFAEECE